MDLSYKEEASGCMQCSDNGMQLLGSRSNQLKWHGEITHTMSQICHPCDDMTSQHTCELYAQNAI
jgi:hypothetical protein